MAAQTQQLLEKLDHIQLDLNFIKEHLEDITLTDDDWASIQEAKEDLRAGRIKRLA